MKKLKQIQPDRMTEIETQWDRSDREHCNPCYIRIDDLGIPQCQECLCIFSFKRGSKIIKKHLEDLYGPDWKEEYKKLKETKKLVKQGKFDKLHLLYYQYTDDQGKIKTDRYFYEKSE